MAVPLFWFAAGVVRRDVGRALIAMRDDETSARTMGVNLATYKTRAFGLSAAYAGVAGALFTFANGFVAPESFTLTVSFAFLAAVVVGGLATVAGAVFGALFIVFVPVWSSDVDEALSGVIYGATLIACMYVFRGGIMGLLRSGSTAGGGEGQPTGGTRMRSLRLLWPVLIAALALVPAACGRDDDGGAAAAAGAAAPIPASPTRRSSSAARTRSAAPPRPTARSARAPRPTSSS